MKKVVVIGQGYVGLPVAMRAVEAGFTVVGIDADVNRVEHLKNGFSYISDISNSELLENLTSGNYLPTSDYKDSGGFDFAIITVPTPLRDSIPDLSYIESSAHALAPHISSGATIILESTTFPGTTESLLAPILEKGSGLKAGEDFFLGYSPERIDPGNAEYGFRETPKLVAGLNPESLERIVELYQSLVDTVIPVSGTKEAELAKILENTFRHVNIALINELAMLSRQLDIDVWEVIEAASTKPFGFMKFTPGPGVGGHCLPVDPSYISWHVKKTLGQPFRFVELANDINDHMPNYVVQRIMEILNEESKPIRGSTIVLVGLAYKKNVNDIRESPAIPIAKLLNALGATVKAIEPLISVENWPADIEPTTVERLNETDTIDLICLLASHDAIDLESLVATGAPVLDTQNVLQGRGVHGL